jgi:hypothetical protein
MFVQQYELPQNLMLDREDNAGFMLETTVAPLWSRKKNLPHNLNLHNIIFLLL